MTLFDSRHLLYQLLWNMFSKEVELADSMQTLFRGNSLASKIMTFCFKVCIHSSIFVQRSVRQYLCTACTEQNVFKIFGSGIINSYSCISLGIWCYLPTKTPRSFVTNRDYFF